MKQVKAIALVAISAVACAVFRNAWREADGCASRLNRKFPMSNVPWAKNQALIRKPACHAGWDWGPAQMTTGFCGPVRLVAHDGLKIDYVYADLLDVRRKGCRFGEKVCRASA